MVAMDISPKAIVERYMDDVLSGRVVAGEKVKRCIRRHLRDLERFDADPDSPYRFDENEAVRPIHFCRYLRHSKGEWAGTEFVPSPWQMFIKWVVFGWIRRSDGARRFNTVYVEVARKNGKTTDLAGIGLYLMVGDGEPGAEVYTAATKLDQAKLIHSEAVRMVQRSPELGKLITIRHNNMHVVETSSKYEPIGADSTTQDGLNVHAGLIDELHAHKNRMIYEVLDSATGARRQPIMWIITTAGFDRHGICWEQRSYGDAVNDPNDTVKDETFFAFIACMDEGDDWREEKNWIKANPNLGVSVKIDDLRRKRDRAIKTPAAENNFRCKHCNDWTEQAERFISMIQWREHCLGSGELEPMDWRNQKIEEMRSEPCVLGLDLSSKVDITALVALWPPAFTPNRKWLVLPWFFCPEHAGERRDKANRERYEQWIREGWMVQTEGHKIDYREIRRQIQWLHAHFGVHEVAHDPWAAGQLTTELEDEDGLVIPEVPQTIKRLSDPMKELEAIILEGDLEHGDNPILSWMASNLACYTDPSGNIRPDKARSLEKIDGMTALITGFTRGLAMNEAGGDPQCYKL